MAYVFKKAAERPELPMLPMDVTLKDGSPAVIDRASGEEELEAARCILNTALLEGNTYPFDEEMDKDTFKAYFLSHDAFVLKHAGTQQVLGIFYIKPNYPGRCSHIANGGFVVEETARGNGVCRKMAETFLVLAKELGYRAVMFNLVFVTNQASVHLWRSLGFKELAVIPSAGNLKTHGFTDAIQFRFEL